MFWKWSSPWWSWYGWWRNHCFRFFQDWHTPELVIRSFDTGKWTPFFRQLSIEKEHFPVVQRTDGWTDLRSCNYNSLGCIDDQILLPMELLINIIKFTNAEISRQNWVVKCSRAPYSVTENQNPPDSSPNSDISNCLTGTEICKETQVSRSEICPPAYCNWYEWSLWNTKLSRTAIAIVQWTKVLKLLIEFMEDQESYYLFYLLYHNDFLRNLHYSGIHSCFPRTMIDSFHHFYMESFHMDSERKFTKVSPNFDEV